MFLQLLPQQMSLLWPAIKKTVWESCPLSGDDLTKYSNNVLKELLSGKYQCWVLYEGHNEIYSLVITSIQYNKLFGFSSLSIDHIYAFRKLTPELVQDGFEKLKKFAENSNCKTLITEITTDNGAEFAERLGFRKVSTKAQYII